MEIREVDDIGIDEAYFPDTRCREIHERGGAEPSSSDAEDRRVFESLLPFLSEFLKKGLAGIANLFFRRHRHGRSLCSGEVSVNRLACRELIEVVEIGRESCHRCTS